MPYADASKQASYMQHYMARYQKEYIAKNPEKVQRYHRNLVLARAMRLGRLPSKRSIERYSITGEELETITQQMSHVKKDKSDHVASACESETRVQIQRGIEAC